VTKIVFIILLLCATRTSTYAQDSQWLTQYIVVAEESNVYKTLRSSAIKLSQQVSIPYSDQDQKWSVKKGLYLREDSDDDIWAGQYFPRRYEDSLITLEMRDYYLDSMPTKPTKTMVVLAGIFDTKQEADFRLKLIKRYRPLAYVRKSKLYMGCIH
jgi:hypothetical protein